jgi:integrase
MLDAFLCALFAVLVGFLSADLPSRFVHVGRKFPYSYSDDVALADAAGLGHFPQQHIFILRDPNFQDFHRISTSLQHSDPHQGLIRAISVPQLNPHSADLLLSFQKTELLSFALHSNSQHTLQHIDCPACEGSRRIAMGHAELGEKTFREAADIWVEMRKMFVQARTTRDNKQYIKTLAAFLGDIKLSDIHIGTIREYQQWRLDNEISGTRINHEMSCLGQILKEAGLWHKINTYYKPLPVSNERIGIALSEEQIRNLFAAARKDTRWEVALHASILSANTTCGPGEIKGLRLGDIDIQNRVMSIHKGKNRFRIRTIPLNDDAIRSARYLLERAKDKGATLPEHYLLPHRAAKRGQGYDPEKPQGHWNRAWNRVREKAGLPHLRQYDLRHTAITRLLENPTVSERVVIELAGHVSNKMLARYSHQRIEAKRKAVSALDDLASNIRGIRVINGG